MSETSIIITDNKLNLFFGLALAAITAYFLFWGLDYTNHNHILVFVLASVFGIFMAFNIGGNDVANSFGTSVGAGTLTIKQALAVAAVFEVSGAVLAGGEVTKTIRKGIVDLGALHVDPMQFIYIMLSALLAAALWLLFATKRGWPVSTTHSIIGAIVGSSITLGIILQGPSEAFSLVQWDKIATIAVSWVLSPLLGGLASYALYSLIKKHILHYNEEAAKKLKKIKKEKKAFKKQHKKYFKSIDDVQKMAYTQEMARDAELMHEPEYSHEDLESNYYKKIHEIEKKKAVVNAHKAMESWVPIVATLGAMVITAMLLFKGLKNMHLEISTLNNILIMAMVGAVVWMATFIYAKTLRKENLNKSTFLIFSWMQVFTASGFAFSHGSNDIANAVGPFAAILDTLRTGEIGASAAIPSAVMITFGVGLIAGLWFIGKEVIQTVGTNLTKMHPASGFSAELAAAAVVMIASMLGLPVSSTHILIGAVLGIGIANYQTNWGLMKPIAMAWIITLPAAGIIASVVFMIFNTFL